MQGLVASLLPQIIKSLLVDQTECQYSHSVQITYEIWHWTG